MVDNKRNMIKQKYIKYLILPSFAIVFVLSLFAGNVFAAGAGQTPGAGEVSFKNPIEFATVDNLLAQVATTVQSIVAVLAVLMIVVAGILYITSAGDQGRVETAKKAITAAIIGLALALAAPALLKEIYDVLGASEAPSVNRTLSRIIIETIKVLSGFVGALSVLMLVVGGIMYIISAGDSAKADTAKNIIQYAIIGLVVALISLVIVTQIIGVF